MLAGRLATQDAGAAETDQCLYKFARQQRQPSAMPASAVHTIRDRRCWQSRCIQPALGSPPPVPAQKLNQGFCAVTLSAQRGRAIIVGQGCKLIPPNI